MEVDKAPGDIEFGYYDFTQAPNVQEALAFANYPISGAFISNGETRTYNNDNAAPAAVSIDTQYRAAADYDSTLLYTLLHEIGHTLGLKHPFEAPVTLPSQIDNSSNTVMSYTGARAPTLGPLDIKAAQTIYGTTDNFASHLVSWNWSAQTETLTQIATSATEFLRGTEAKDIINTGGGADTVVLAGGDDLVIADGSKIIINGGDRV